MVSIHPLVLYTSIIHSIIVSIMQFITLLFFFFSVTVLYTSKHTPFSNFKPRLPFYTNTCLKNITFVIEPIAVNQLPYHTGSFLFFSFFHTNDFSHYSLFFFFPFFPFFLICLSLTYKFLQQAFTMHTIFTLLLLLLTTKQKVGINLLRGLSNASYDWSMLLQMGQSQWKF